MDLHRRLLAPAAVAVTVAAVGVSAPGLASADPDGGREHLLRSGLVGSLVDDPALFGANPGGAPWVTDHNSSVRLRSDGHLDVKIRGLVIPGRGNPVAMVSASVACNGEIVATTSQFPMGTVGSKAGDARIRTTLDLPDRCLTPAVLVHPADRVGTYIAVNGSAAR